MPPISNPFINMSYNLFNFLSFRRTFGLFRQFSLSLCKHLLVSFKKARIFYFVLSRKCSKILQANIYPNGFIIFWQRFVLILNRKASIPFTVLPSNGAGFNGAFNGPMKFDFNIPYFRKIKNIFDQLKTQLGKGETIIAVKSFKARITRLKSLFNSTKESLESKVNPGLSILKTLRINVSKFRFILFPQSKYFIGIIQRQRFLFFFPSIFANCKSFIINIATSVKKTLQSSLLFFSRIQSIFICFTHNKSISQIYLDVKCYFSIVF